MQKLSLILYKYSSWFLSLLVGVMVFVTLLEVGSRNLFNHSFVWSEELSRFLLIWITFIGASVVYKRGELVALDGMGKLPDKIRLYVYILTQIIVVVFIAFLAYLGFGTTFSKTVVMQTATGLRISMMYPYLAIPIGMLFMLIHAIAFILSPKSDDKELTT